MWTTKEIMARLKELGIPAMLTPGKSIGNLLMYLSDDESIEYALTCKKDKQDWFVVCTDRRLLILLPKIFKGTEMHEVPFGKLSSVSTEQKILSAYLVLKMVDGSEMRFSAATAFAARMQSVISNRIRRGQNAQIVINNSAAKSYDKDPYEEVKKLKGLLDMGAITQEEFDLKKKQLLGL